MREHQIVITLKPEQFQEVQRLSRAAGAKSMGIFVRQQLLAALGIEGGARAAKTEAASVDAKRLASELRRLHGELRAFVGESLPTPYIAEKGESLPEQEAHSVPAPALGEYAEGDEGEQVAEAFPEPLGAGRGGAPPASVDAFEHSQETLEQLARRAFAISPKMGALEPAREEESQSEAESRGLQRDPLEELLEGSTQAQTRGKAGAPQGLSGQGPGEDEERLLAEEEEEEETVDVSVPFAEGGTIGPAERSGSPRPEPPPPPPLPSPPSARPSLGGGPPPRRRRS